MIVFHIDLKHKRLLDILFYRHINNHFFLTVRVDYSSGRCGIDHAFVMMQHPF